MDVARFGDYASPQYGTIKSSENYERRFIMTFPNETLPKGRKQKTTALYDRFVNQGAVMGDSFGLENVLWFANNIEDAHEELFVSIFYIICKPQNVFQTKTISHNSTLVYKTIIQCSGFLFSSFW